MTSRHCLPTDNDVPPSSSSESELPVAYGRWGKPKCLADAKYDFLMLDATVISTKDPCDRVHIGMIFFIVFNWMKFSLALELYIKYYEETICSYKCDLSNFLTILYIFYNLIHGLDENA